MGLRIDRCVCTNRTFAELLAFARRARVDLASLRECTGAGAHCGLCRPYLVACLRDGVTVFDRVLPADAADDDRRP